MGLMRLLISVVVPMPHTLGLYKLSSSFLGLYAIEAVAGGTGVVRIFKGDCR